MVATLKTNWGDIDIKITSVEDAKKYAKYNNKALEKDSDKNIFNDPTLIEVKADGSLGDNPDLNKVKRTVEFLSLYKEAEEIVKTEVMGLSENGHELIARLIGEQKKKDKSIPYCLVNGGVSDGRVDKVIDQLEDILFSESDYSSELKLQKHAAALESLRDERAKKMVEIDNLKLGYDYESKKRAERYKTFLTTPVTGPLDLLEADLNSTNASHIGLNILQRSVDITKAYTDVVFRLDRPNSVIETEYKVSGENFTLPQYLYRDLPQQFIGIFKDFDKQKLFEIIKKKFPDAEAKKIEGCFERIISWETGNSWNFPRSVSVRKKPVNLKDNKGSLAADGFKSWVMNKQLYMSDLLYFMHKLFPQGTTDWSTIDFLQPNSDNCLPFNSGSSLDKKHGIIWLGRDAAIKGETPPILTVLDTNLHRKDQKVSWAGGEIPDFFWKAYNRPSATTFGVYREVLSKDGVSPRRLREEEISQFERDELITYSERHRLVYGLIDSYKEHADEIIKGTFSHSTEFKYEEFKGDWEVAFKEFWASIINIWQHWKHERKRAGMTPVEFLKEVEKESRGLLKWNSPDPVNFDEPGITSNIIGIWRNEMIKIADNKIGSFLEVEGKLGRLQIEINAIDAKITKEQVDYENAEKAIEKFKKNRLKGLREQFNQISSKSRNTYAEVSFLRSILGLIEEWETLDPDPAFDFAAKRNALNQTGITEYYSWEKLGGNFAERLDVWKKNDGKYYNEKAVRAYLVIVQSSLEGISSGIGGRELDAVEKNELEEIKKYLSETPKQPEKSIFPADLRAALGIKTTNIFSDLVKKWKNFSSSKDFKKDTKEIKEIADKINGKDSKIKKPDFIKYLKEKVATKPNVPAFPDDSATEQAKLDWFFSLDPKIVIETIASQELVADSVLKETIIKEMKDAKDGDKVLDNSPNGYGDGKNFTDDGINKYYSEKIGGIAYSYSKQQDKGPGDKDGLKSFWSWDNPLAIISGVCIGAAAGIIIAGIIYWDKIAAWWDGPANAEGNGDSDETDDE